MMIHRQIRLLDFVALSINTIEEEDVKLKDIRALVRQHPSGYKLNNWSATDIPVVFSPLQ